MPLLALLGGVPWKALGAAAVIAAILLGCGYAVHQHDARILAEQQLAQAQFNLNALTVQAKKNEGALTDNLAAIEARGKQTQATKGKIASVPVVSACANSGAIRAALDGLRPAPTPAPTVPRRP